jgi:hypothetical protein
MRFLPAQLALPAQYRLPVLVSGDLTAAGTVNQFAGAPTFLGSSFILRRERRSAIGLNIPEDMLESIPGNHDQWSGRRVLPSGSNPAATKHHFRASPWMTRWPSQDGRIELELYGIDSNAGVSGTNQLARGSVQASDLRDLEDMLSESSRNQGAVRVRALTLHHSLAYRGGPLPRVPLPTRLDNASITELLRIAAQHQISAFLTGHTHDEYHHQFPSSPSQAIHEFRAPTTLQGPASASHAGLLLHTVTLEDNGDIMWSASLYRWKAGPRFEQSRGVWPPFRIS